MNWKIGILIVVILIAIASPIWRQIKTNKAKEGKPKKDEEDKDEHKKNDDVHPPAKPESAWSKALATLGLWIGGLITAGAVFIGCYMTIQKINQGQPERQEFSGYYQYWIENPDGSINQGVQVQARVTPNTFNASYIDSATRQNVTLRWSRGGDGVWTMSEGRHTHAGLLRLTNVSNDPKGDFETFKQTILGVMTDDEDQSKKVKFVLKRL